MTVIEITIEDDGTFSVETEEKQVEAQEQETSTGQKFTTTDEALAAVKQLMDESSMGGGEMPMEQTEEQAMSEAYRPGVQGR